MSFEPHQYGGNLIHCS